MTDTMRKQATAGGFNAETGTESDYRIREVEARLDRRITVIEAQRGRAKLVSLITGAGLMVTLVVLVVVLRAIPPSDGEWMVDRLSAGELLLTDVDGVERGRLATDADGQALLTLSDRDGRERIRLTVLADGSPGVTINDADARPRAVLGYLPDGTTNLVFADAQGVGRAVVGIDPDGSSQALFMDGDGTIRTQVGVGADGAPSVSVVEEPAGGGRSPSP